MLPAVIWIWRLAIATERGSALLDFPNSVPCMPSPISPSSTCTLLLALVVIVSVRLTNRSSTTKLANPELVHSNSKARRLSASIRQVHSTILWIRLITALWLMPKKSYLRWWAGRAHCGEETLDVKAYGHHKRLMEIIGMVRIPDPANSPRSCSAAPRSARHQV